MEEAMKDGGVIKETLGKALKLDVAAAMADYHETVVEMMAIVSQRFGEVVTLQSSDSKVLITVYKHILKARRAAGEDRVFTTAQKDPELLKHVEEESSQKKKELQTAAKDVQAMLQDLRTSINTIQPVDSATQVSELEGFLWKLEGDFFHFLALLEKDVTARKTICESGRTAYETGFKILEGTAVNSLFRLGLEFSFSIFEADVCGERTKALQIALDVLSRKFDDKECITIQDTLKKACFRWQQPTQEQPAAT
eukprot:m.62201 g.62201  ORF g.62201 m.62201 type:complete len:253 (-) comp23106_c0_seq1:25-783(-)